MSVLTLSGDVAAEDVDAYVAALFGLLGSRDPVDVLAETPAELARLVGGLTAEQAIRPEAPGKWSARHVVQHLADSELVGGYRLRLVLAQERPPLSGYDQDDWASRLGYDGVPIADALEQFTLLRRLNLRYWGGLKAADLARAGMHAERGEETLERMRRLYAGHDLAHRAQLERVCRAASGSPA